MVKVSNFKVIVEQDSEGYFVASVPAIPGCHTQGKTYEEALKNIKEAIGLCLEVASEDLGYRAKIDLEEVKEGCECESVFPAEKRDNFLKLFPLLVG